jgi:hypothetical protein
MVAADGRRLDGASALAVQSKLGRVDNDPAVGMALARRGRAILIGFICIGRYRIVTATISPIHQDPNPHA